MFGAKAFELTSQQNLQHNLTEEHSLASNQPCDEKAQLINMANKMFGFNGWSYSVIKQTIDFIDTNDSYKVGVWCSVKVMLKDGTFREDCGYGIGEAECKGQAVKRARKMATAEALGETLKGFGSIFQNVTKSCSFPSEFAGSSVRENRNNGLSSSVKNLISPEGSSGGGESNTDIKYLPTSLSSTRILCQQPVESISKNKNLNGRISTPQKLAISPNCEEELIIPECSSKKGQVLSNNISKNNSVTGQFTSPQLLVNLDKKQPVIHLEYLPTSVLKKNIFNNGNEVNFSHEKLVNIPDNKEPGTPLECQSNMCLMLIDDNSKNKCRNGIIPPPEELVTCDGEESDEHVEYSSFPGQLEDIPDNNEPNTALELQSTSSKRRRQPIRKAAKRSRKSSNKTVKRCQNSGIIENSSAVLVKGNTSEQYATATNEVSSEGLIESQNSSSMLAVEMQSQDNCLLEKDSSFVEVKIEPKVLPSESIINSPTVRNVESDSKLISNVSNVKKVNLNFNEQTSSLLSLQQYNCLTGMLKHPDKSELYLF